MNTYVSLLRGINVGGSKRLGMDLLRQIYAGAGFTHIRTYVQSGNVIFEAPDQEESDLSAQIEARIEQECGFEVRVFIRHPSALLKVLGENPFLIDRQEDPSKLHVTFLYLPVAESVLHQLIPPPGISDEFALGDRMIYLFCPNGYGKTRLANTFFERKLHQPVTTRNWNTVNALYRLTQS